MSTSVFRKALGDRGLTELLDLHIRAFPPAGQVDMLLMRRDLKLAEAADVYRSVQERRDALSAANRLLAEAIEVNPDDQRTLAWRFDLAHSLIYEEAEPYFSSILYRGGSPEDARLLCDRTSRAIDIVTALSARLVTEYEKLDNLSVKDFERLERRGVIETMDRLAPKADYLLLWSLLYDALGRKDTSLERAADLSRIVAQFASDSSLLETPHDVSKVQVQALLLAGMTYRLLNDHSNARRFLKHAIDTSKRLEDGGERARVAWATTLARIEQIRNDRDDGRFGPAIERLHRFRRVIVSGEKNPFGLLLVAALLERTVHQAHAAEALHDGDDATAARFRDRAWESLLLLVQRHPKRRDEVYTTVVELIGRDADPRRLDPFEQTALVAGLLFDDGSDQAIVRRRQEESVTVGRRFVDTARGRATALVPEVLYNVGVALYRLNRTEEAISTFLVVATDHADYDGALSAITYAVQLASARFQAQDGGDADETRALYLQTLADLIHGFPKSSEAAYWRFFYAQALEEDERFGDAATQYALVESNHPNALDASLSRLRCMRGELTEMNQLQTPDALVLQRLQNEFVDVHRAFGTQLRASLRGTQDDRLASKLRAMLAAATVIKAEAQVLPSSDRAMQAIESLVDFETEYPEFDNFAGRIWRVRLMAYEQLDKLAEARRAIPAFVAADPDRAGPTLQELYLSLADDADRLREQGPSRKATRKADLALLLAQQVVAWTEGRSEYATQQQRRPLMLQLAEANLRAGHYQTAKDLFLATGARGNTPPSVDDPLDATTDYGLAEAMYHLKQYDDALPRFNNLAMRLPEDAPLRWRCLLRDLQCRTALGHPPAGIIKVIDQQAYLNAELGGPRLRQQFEKLRRENERRATGK